MRALVVLDRALTLQAPVTPARYIAFIGHLIVLYVGTGIVGGLLAIVGASAYALATPAPEPPDPAWTLGCPMALPPAGRNDPRPLMLSGYGGSVLALCEPIALPLSYGASVRDGAGGRR